MFLLYISCVLGLHLSFLMIFQLLIKNIYIYAALDCAQWLIYIHVCMYVCSSRQISMYLYYFQLILNNLAFFPNQDVHIHLLSFFIKKFFNDIHLAVSSYNCIHVCQI
jgi:hypothetical protein